MTTSWPYRSHDRGLWPVPHFLCCIKKETNSVEELFALLSRDDVRGDAPLHLIQVGRFFWLLPFLVAWAHGFRFGWRPLVWVAVLFLASIRDAVTRGVHHGDILPLALGCRGVSIHRTTLWGIVSCFLPSKRLGCLPDNCGWHLQHARVYQSPCSVGPNCRGSRRRSCLSMRLHLDPVIWWLGHSLGDNCFWGSAHLVAWSWQSGQLMGLIN